MKNIEILKEFIKKLTDENRSLKEEIRNLSSSIGVKRSLSANDGNGFDAKQLIDISDDIVFAVDAKFRLIVFNTKFEDFAEKNSNLSVRKGNSIFEYLPSEDNNYWKILFEECMQNYRYREEYNFVNDNSNVYYEVIFNNLEKDDKIIGVSVFMRDITDKNNLENSLTYNLNEQILVSEILKSMMRPDDFTESVIYSLGLIGKFADLTECYVYEDYDDSEYARQTYCWSSHKIDNLVVDISYSVLFNWKKHIEDKGFIIYGGNEILPFDILSFFKNRGSASSVIFPIMVRGCYYGFIGFGSSKESRLWKVGEIDVMRTFANIISNAIMGKKMEDRIKYASTHDPLTGLYNRAYYETELDRVRKGRNFPVLIFIIDLNGLKYVNDNIGHSAGDELIKGAAVILNSVFRKDDCVARIGGDEFAVIVSNADYNKGEEIVKRLRIVESEQRKDKDLKVSMAVGYAEAKDGSDVSDAIDKADKFMYENKRYIKSGRLA